MSITNDWYSLKCPNGCEDPAIHEEGETEHITNCQTCDLIEREDADTCEVCNEEGDGVYFCQNCNKRLFLNDDFIIWQDKANYADALCEECGEKEKGSK